jgi:hypothetical protein
MLACALLGTTALSGCGVQIESIAQLPMIPAAPAASSGPPPAQSFIFAPCISGAPAPLSSPASKISDLLMGKDQFRSSCTHNPGTGVQLDNVVDSAQKPATAVPAGPDKSGLVVTDELVSAVLTGTGEYWYQPVVGPA